MVTIGDLNSAIAQYSKGFNNTHNLRVVELHTCIQVIVSTLAVSVT